MKSLDISRKEIKEGDILLDETDEFYYVVCQDNQLQAVSDYSNEELELSIPISEKFINDNAISIVIRKENTDRFNKLFKCFDIQNKIYLLTQTIKDLKNNLSKLYEQQKKEFEYNVEILSEEQGKHAAIIWYADLELQIEDMYDLIEKTQAEKNYLTSRLESLKNYAGVMIGYEIL